MLMFIAILHVITGLLVPLLSPNSEYEAARNRRNAQEISMVYSAAKIAGLNFAGSSLDATIKNVMAGGRPTSGAFKDHKFAVSLLSDADIAGAANYLKLNDGQLVYTLSNSASQSGAIANSGSGAKQNSASNGPSTPSAPIKWSLTPSSGPSQAGGTRLRARL